MAILAPIVDRLDFFFAPQKQGFESIVFDPRKPLLVQAIVERRPSGESKARTG